MTRNPPEMCYDRILPKDQLLMTSMVASRTFDTAVFITSKLWESGDKIKCSFIGGTSVQRQNAIDAARQISEHAFLDFDFLTTGVGTIRIAFNVALGAWSNLGTDAKSVTRSQPTMNLGFNQPGTYVHEVGHAVGMIHEHQTPFGNSIVWNKAQVIHDLSGPPNNWNSATIQHNMFDRMSVAQVNGSQFDPKSIMLYSFPASWTVDGWHVDPNTVLSALDKLWLSLKYPGRVVAPPIDPPVPPVDPIIGEKDFIVRVSGNRIISARILP